MRHLLLARLPGPATLPPVVHTDTETVTNVPFTASLDAAGCGLEGHGEAGRTAADAVLAYLVTGTFPKGVAVKPSWVVGETF